MENEYFKKVIIKSESDLPKESGNYLTEFGWLYFNGKWIYPTNRTFTRGIFWYLLPISQSTPLPVRTKEIEHLHVFQDFVCVDCGAIFDLLSAEERAKYKVKGQ